jgi:hypothetical protein
MLAIACTLSAIMAAPPAAARDLRNGGKLVLTDGVTSVEGSSGGGLSTWALIAGNETDAGIGATAHATRVTLPDFDLTSFGAAVGYRNRVELSYAHQDFNTRRFGATLGLGRDFTFSQDIVGVKLRLVGDAVYDQDRVLPQISIGAQYKHANRGAVIAAVGGKQASGVDFYVSATKVVLSKGVVLGATFRLTKANQFGLLGFGGDKSAAYRPQFEGSLGKLIKRNLLVGVEYRTKPDNLRFAREQSAHDVFAAWAVTRNVTLTGAYADLGSIATSRRQRGLFASVQASF